MNHSEGRISKCGALFGKIYVPLHHVCKEIAKLHVSDPHGSRPHNIGNPVFTFAEDIPVNQMPSSAPFCQSADVLYRTTNGDYGRRDPTVHTAPSTYWPRANQFTEHLGKCGMYRNRSLNCAIDKCNILDY